MCVWLAVGSWWSASSPTLANEPPPPGFFPLQHRWTADLSEPPATAPAFDGGLAFVPLRNNTLAAIELIQGTVLWTSDHASDWPPVAHNEIVVVSAGRTASGLRAIDGALLWFIDFGVPISSPPVLAHGWLVVGLDSGEIVVLRGEDGAEIWRQQLLGRLEVEASVAGAHLFVPVADGRVIMFDLVTGARIWEQRLGGSPQGILAVDNVFVGATDNLMYCLSRLNGDVVWKWRTGADIIGRPALDEQRVFFVSLDNLLRALDRTNGGQHWRQPLPARPTSGPQRIGNRVVVSGVAPEVLTFDAVSGEPSGFLTTPGELAAPARILRSPSALAPGVVLTMGDGRLSRLGDALGPGTFTLTFPPPPLLVRPPMLAPQDVLPFVPIDSTSDSTDPERPGPRLTPPADVLPFIPLPSPVSPDDETTAPAESEPEDENDEEGSETEDRTVALQAMTKARPSSDNA